MASFLFNPIGTAGDVYPHIAVGMELLRRGHSVELLSIPNYRSLAETNGLSFHAIGEELDFQKHAMDERVKRPYSAWKAALEWAALGMMRSIHTAITDRAARSSLVVISPPWSLGARLARETSTIKLANMVMNPVLFRSCVAPPKLPYLPMPSWTPRWFKRLQYWTTDSFVVDPILKPTLNAFRKELGLDPINRIMNRWWFSPDLVMGLFEPPLVRDPGDWLVSVELMGHTQWDPPTTETAQQQLQSFLDVEQPFVLFVPGSAGPITEEIPIVIFDACQRLGFRLLYLSALPCPLTLSQKPGFLQLRYVPIAPPLERCQLVIHSASIGVTTHALSRGVPQLVIPSVNDQFDNAQRIERLGIGRALKPYQCKSQVIEQQIQFLTSQDFAAHIKRKRLDDSLVSMRSTSKRVVANNIADRLEILAEQQER